MSKPKGTSRSAAPRQTITVRLHDQIEGKNKRTYGCQIEILFNIINILRLNQVWPHFFDVRCYVYEEQVKLVIARFYQSQTTNFRTAGGGFALVRVDS